MVAVATSTAADWTAIGTLVRVVVTEPTALPDARRILVDDLAALDLACSRFRPDSELRRLDDGCGRPVPVTPLLAEALATALEAARRTDGDVDPTVGLAMADIGYDRDFGQVLPDGPVLRLVASPAPGWEGVELDVDRGTVTVPPGVRLDLGATAKALAADRAARRIVDETGSGVLVSLGGDLRAAGPTPDGGWQVRVQDVTGHPDDAPIGPVAQVALHTGGLATSSTAARRWVRGGDVLHHITDPRRGLPADTPWRTVTVAAPTCVAANTASTAAVIRGDRAPRWLESMALAARLVNVDGTVRTVGAWPVAQEGEPA
jgi:thiamine biosynthesis lipoprotein ApbE